MFLERIATGLGRLFESKDVVVVTRHPGLLEYLKGVGLYQEGMKVVQHATPEDVRGKHVIGILTPSLAALADKVTEVAVDIPLELRGKELGIEDIKKHVKEIWTYKVVRVD